MSERYMEMARTAKTGDCLPCSGSEKIILTMDMPMLGLRFMKDDIVGCGGSWGVRGGGRLSRLSRRVRQVAVWQLQIAKSRDDVSKLAGMVGITRRARGGGTIGGSLFLVEGVAMTVALAGAAALMERGSGRKRPTLCVTSQDSDCWSSLARAASRRESLDNLCARATPAPPLFPLSTGDL